MPIEMSLGGLESGCDYMSFPLGLLKRIVLSAGRNMFEVKEVIFERVADLRALDIEIRFLDGSVMKHRCLDIHIKAYVDNWEELSPVWIQTKVEHKPESWVTLDTMRTLV